MIILDSSEVRSTSTMPEIEGAVLSPDLESLTGADACISIFAAPCNNDTLLKLHLRSRCILIQIKRHEDFLSSIMDERINLAIAKMRQWTTAPWQRLILSTGVFVPDLNTGDILLSEPVLRDGNTSLWLRESNVPLSFKSYDTITHRILMGGASYIGLVATEALPSKLKKLEQDLMYLSGKPVKDLFMPEAFPDDLPDEDDPLQVPQPVSDGRLLLASIPGVGPKKATAMWEHVRDWMREGGGGYQGKKEDRDPTPLQLLVWATSTKAERKRWKQSKVTLWGDRSYEIAREWMGLSGNQIVRLDFDVEGRKGKGAGVKERYIPGMEEEK